MKTAIQIFLLFLLSSSFLWSQRKEQRVENVSVSYKTLNRPQLSYIFYDEARKLVDDFQNDVRSMTTIYTDKTYRVEEGSQLASEVKEGESKESGVALDYKMLSASVLNIAIVGVDVSPTVEKEAKKFLYQEIMSRNYTTRGGQTLNFIDTFLFDTTTTEYSDRKVITGQSSYFSDEQVDQLRKTLYFDYYARVKLVRKGTKLTLQIIVYDVKTKAIVMLNTHDTMTANTYSFVYDLDFYYHVVMLMKNQLVLPMNYGLNIGRKLYRVGSVGLNMEGSSFLVNAEIASDYYNTYQALRPKDRVPFAVKNFSFTTFSLGPYFMFNFNDLARSKTSVFEFLLGFDLKLGFYIPSQTLYSIVYFDPNIFFRVEVWHWFFVDIGVEIPVFKFATDVPEEKKRLVGNKPYGPALFTVGLGLNIF